MTHPLQLLIIDDQFGRDAAERALLLRRIGLNDDLEKPWAEVQVVSGQIRHGDIVRNDYDSIRQAVLAGWGKAVPAPWSLVLLDVRFDSGKIGADGLPDGRQPGDDTFGEDTRDQLLREFPGLPLVLLSSMSQSELEKQDAPYLSKTGLDSCQLKDCLLRHGRLEPSQRRDLLQVHSDIVASADGTLEAFRKAFLAARGDASVLLMGESGTGKEVMARYIHARSPRRDGPFRGLSIATIPRDQIEAELFGIERGTATNVDRRSGYFEDANDGTLFLDEIGDLPLDVQPKLLRVLQENEFNRIGGRKTIRLNVRLISATSRDLAQMIRGGSFREDLLYRINTFELRLPALRDRRSEILDLADRLVDKYSKEAGLTGVTLSSSARQLLQVWDYPGNVRELENVIRRIVIHSGNERVVSESEVSDALRGSGSIESSVSRSEAVPSPRITALANLPDLLASVEIQKDDECLAGARMRIEAAYEELQKRLAGAVLDKYREGRDGGFNLQGAMQYLTGDHTLKGKAPSREMNKILKRTQNTPITPEDLETLVRLWKGKVS